MIFCDLLWFFKDLVKIKNKRKIEKPLPPHPQTAQGGYVNGFVSPRRLDGQFCGPERKSRFGSKLREVKKNFSKKKCHIYCPYLSWASCICGLIGPWFLTGDMLCGLRICYDGSWLYAVACNGSIYRIEFVDDVSNLHKFYTTT